MTSSDPAAYVRATLRRRKPASVFNSEIIVAELVHFLEEHYPHRSGSALLDLGAGVKPYAPLYEPYFENCLSVDVPQSPHDISDVDTLASADALPFADATFECVICTEVLEHCKRPRVVVEEIARVLRPGGRVFLTTPFLTALHEMPYDYYRYTPSALQDLAESAGLDVTLIRPRGDYVAVLLQLLAVPPARLWYLASRLTRLPLYRQWNPFVFTSVVLPQLAYAGLWRRQILYPNGLLSQLQRRLDYYTLGYTTTLVKPAGR